MMKLAKITLEIITGSFRADVEDVAKELATKHQCEVQFEFNEQKYRAKYIEPKERNAMIELIS